MSLKLLDQFEKCSGLKVNCTKTKAIWIGSSCNNVETPLALKWCKTTKALGVHFSYNNEEFLKRIFMTNSEESNLKYTRGVGNASPLFGKVTTIKTLLLAKVTYFVYYSFSCGIY